MFTRENFCWHAKRLLKACLIATALGVIGGVLAIICDFSFGTIHEDTRQGIGLCVGAICGLVLSYRIDQLPYTNITLKLIGGIGLVTHVKLYISASHAMEMAVGWNGLPYFFFLIILMFTAVAPIALFLSGFVRIRPRSDLVKDG